MAMPRTTSMDAKEFDIDQVLGADASIAEQHPIVVDLTQSFGESSSKMVSAHINSQQDGMCEDIMKEVEKRMAELMRDPSFSGENAGDIAKLSAAMGGSMRKSVDKIKGINISVSQPSVHNFVQEMAKDHLDTLVDFSVDQKDKADDKHAVADKKAAEKAVRQQAALKITMQTQAGTRAQEMKDQIKALQDSLPGLKDELGDLKSKAESAEKIVQKNERAGREMMELLEAEQKTLQDKRNAMKKKIRNEALQVDKEKGKVDGAKGAANKVDMRRQVVQGQLDMVLKMNARAKIDQDDQEEEEAAYRPTGSGREAPKLAGFKGPQKEASKKYKVIPAPGTDDDWDEKIQNLIDRFSIPKELSEKMLLEAQGHAGKAVMALGLDVITREGEAEIRDLFNTIDEDGSGTLETNEIAALAIELGCPMSDDEVAAAMADMDTDGGGDVDWEEFLFWWQDQQNQPPGQSSAFKFADALNSTMSKVSQANDKRAARRNRKSAASEAAQNANSMNAMRGR